MKKLVGILTGLSAFCLLLGGMTLSREIYFAKAAVIEDEPMATAAADAVIQGVVRWKDDNGYIHPCRNVKIHLYKGTKYIAEQYTDNEGNYSFYTSAADSVSIYVYAQTNLNTYGGSSNPVKMIKSGNGNDVYLDVKIEKNVSGHLSIDCDYDMSTPFGKAMQILQAATTAARYAAAMGKSNLPEVEIWYPYSNKYVAEWTNSRIEIGNAAPKENAPEAYASWDMIMHEYGHHVQSAYKITESQGGAHESHLNDIDSLCDNYIRDNSIDGNTALPSEFVETGIKLAWGESWPTVFAFMAQQYAIEQMGMSDLAWIPTVGDTIEDSFQIVPEHKFDMATHVNKLGEACEDSIIAILYKLYCYAPYSFGHKKMWNCVMNSNAVTFSQFLNYLIDNNYLTESQAMTLVAPYGMRPSGLGIIDNDAQLEPTLIWEGTGGSVYFPYNYFEIDIYNEAGSQLYHFNTGYTVDDEGVYRLNLNKIYWDNILRQQGGQFSFKVSAYQKRGSFKTGPYIAGKQIKKPYEDFDCSRSYGYAGKILKKPNECAWFRYVAPYSGKYRFDIGVGTESGTQTDNQATVIVFPYMAYSIGNGRIFTATGTDMTYECQLVEGQELYFYMSINQGGTGMVFARTYLIQRTQSTLSLVKNLQYNLWLPTSASEIPRFRLIP